MGLAAPVPVNGGMTFVIPPAPRGHNRPPPEPGDEIDFSQHANVRVPKGRPFWLFYGYQTGPGPWFYLPRDRVWTGFRTWHAPGVIVTAEVSFDGVEADPIRIGKTGEAYSIHEQWPLVRTNVRLNGVAEKILGINGKPLVVKQAEPQLVRVACSWSTNLAPEDQENLFERFSKGM